MGLPVAPITHCLQGCALQLRVHNRVITYSSVGFGVTGRLYAAECMQRKMWWIGSESALLEIPNVQSASSSSISTFIGAVGGKSQTTRPNCQPRNNLNPKPPKRLHTKTPHYRQSQKHSLQEIWDGFRLTCENLRVRVLGFMVSS